MPKFSVITINFNNHKGLKRTIESIINQSFLDFEFIIIDGGSNDDSSLIIDFYKNKIDLIIAEPDNGIYDAMNKGLKYSRGEYCIFMNSGDIFVDNSVLKNVENLLDPSSDIIYGCHLWESSTGERWNPKENFKLHEIFSHTPISHQATFIKRKVLNNLGGFKTKYKVIADWGILVDALYHKYKMQKIKLDICIAEKAGESNSYNNYKILNERKSYLRNNYLIYYIWNYYLNKIKKKLKNLIY